jgi:hypothetical protein
MSDLSNVQVGDFVISHCRAGARVLKVVKITPTQIVTVGNKRYRKKDGYAIGSGGFYYDYATIPKEGVVESIRRRNFVADVCIKGKKMFDSYSISYEQAVKIKEILNL